MLGYFRNVREISGCNLLMDSSVFGTKAVVTMMMMMMMMMSNGSLQQKTRYVSSCRLEFSQDAVNCNEQPVSVFFMMV